jgi:hypothetical protein
VPKNSQTGVTRASSWKRKVEEIRSTARFGGFYIPEDVSPIDVLLDELKRSTAFCAWIESKMAEWADELVPLGKAHEDDKGSLQQFATNEAAWIEVWQKERRHLATVAKMCIDAGVSERQVQLAEKQADVMFMLINEAFDMLRLSPEQQAVVPKIMPALIRRMALPGEVVKHDA